MSGFTEEWRTGVDHAHKTGLVVEKGIKNVRELVSLTLGKKLEAHGFDPSEVSKIFSLLNATSESNSRDTESPIYEVRRILRDKVGTENFDNSPIVAEVMSVYDNLQKVAQVEQSDDLHHRMEGLLGPKSGVEELIIKLGKLGDREKTILMKLLSEDTQPLFQGLRRIQVKGIDVFGSDDFNRLIDMVPKMAQSRHEDLMTQFKKAITDAKEKLE